VLTQALPKLRYAQIRPLIDAFAQAVRSETENPA